MTPITDYRITLAVGVVIMALTFVAFRFIESSSNVARDFGSSGGFGAMLAMRFADDLQGSTFDDSDEYILQRWAETRGDIQPGAGGEYLEPDEVLAIAGAGERHGCTEALFTLGDRPEDRWDQARRFLDERHAPGHGRLAAHLDDRGIAARRGDGVPRRDAVQDGRLPPLRVPHA